MTGQVGEWASVNMGKAITEDEVKVVLVVLGLC